MQLKKATKIKSKLRILIAGLPGSGKTYSALNIAKYLGDKILLLDSEYGSASKYADIFDFYTEEITDHDPRHYIKMIKEADDLGVDVIVIDSLSHAWQALLDIASEEGKKSHSPYGGWGKATPIQRELVEAMLASKCHIIATARQKSEYVIETNEKGKQQPKKVGLKAEQKENIDYEFDIAGEIDSDHTLRITKSRCPEVDGKSFYKPGKEFAETLKSWLEAGIEPVAIEKKTAAAPADSNMQTATVGVEQMKQLLTAGINQGWTKEEIASLIDKTFKTKTLTWKQWELAVKLVGAPPNKGGNEVLSLSPEYLDKINEEPVE